MLAAPTLIGRLMSIYSPGVSGKENRINPRWRPNLKKDIYHHSPSPIPIICHLPLISRWSLPLKMPKCAIYYRSDFHDFSSIKSLREEEVGQLVVKNKKNYI
jgi:hypothetical protein